MPWDANEEISPRSRLVREERKRGLICIVVVLIKSYFCFLSRWRRGFLKALLRLSNYMKDSPRHRSANLHSDKQLQDNQLNIFVSLKWHTATPVLSIKYREKVHWSNSTRIKRKAMTWHLNWNMLRQTEFGSISRRCPRNEPALFPVPRLLTAHLLKRVSKNVRPNWPFTRKFCDGTFTCYQTILQLWT